MNNIALLISSKSYDFYQDDTDYIFLNECLQSFLVNLSLKNEINIYIGYDEEDEYFTKNIDKIITNLKKIIKDNYCENLVRYLVFNFKNTENPTSCVIWNKLFKKAYDNKNDYFFQIDDDIIINMPNWDDMFISRLKENDNLGLTGLNHGKDIITYSFVSRKHYNFFEKLFNEKFKNNGYDEWINQVYGSYMVYQFPKSISKNKENVLISGYLNKSQTFNKYFFETIIKDRTNLKIK